jgi:hypothetical protein
MKSSISAVQSKGEHGTCPVVKVEANNEQGFTEINESDFDEAMHKRWTPSKRKTSDAADWSKKTKSEISDHLASLGIEHDPDARKDDLLALVPQ